MSVHVRTLEAAYRAVVLICPNPIEEGAATPEAAIAGAVTEARAHLRGLLALLPPEQQVSLTEAIDAQRWAMIRAAVLRLDAVARPGAAMADDDVEQVVLRVLERAGRRTQKAPEPVEWRTRIDVEEATIGAFALLVESDGWRLEVCDGTGDYWIVDSGDETGPDGKAAAEAAYRRACGLPAIPACAG